MQSELFPAQFSLLSHLHEMEQQHQQQHQPQHQQEYYGGATGSLRDLLLDCAAAVDRRHWAVAAYCASALSQRSSAQGNAEERLAHYCAAALAGAAASDGAAEAAATAELLSSGGGCVGGSGGDGGDAYLALNQVTPFVRFAHLSANQAILEAVDGERAVHIVDCDIMHGLQWPPLMQALVERRRPAAAAVAEGQPDELELEAPPLHLRITATGPWMDHLEATGARLRDFATTLGLPFEFEAICCSTTALSLPPRHLLRILADEALVVNSMSQLHSSGSSDETAAVAAIRALAPRVVTIAEREQQQQRRRRQLVERVAAAVEDYAPVYESLDATLPPRSPQRLMIERSLLGREIASIIGGGGGGGGGGGAARSAMNSGGFVAVAPSDFAIAQARLLLRLHYPSDGYRLLVPGEDHDQHGTLFISWAGRPLFAVSAWIVNKATTIQQEEQIEEELVQQQQQQQQV